MTGSDRYITFWYEVLLQDIKFNCKTSDDMGNFTWFPLNSGGEFRYYYGNNMKVVNLWHDGFEIRKNVKNYRVGSVRCV